MKNIFFVIIAVVSCFCNANGYAADPCGDDPSCIKAENARFDNPNHYVFIAAYPGDELLIYPLLKDHCSDAGSYCAMIIATQGKSGCEFGSDSNCGKLRMLELEESSKYLNVDVWHYDLPDSKTITPNTLEQTRWVYQQIAKSAGLNNVADYFQSMFNKLRHPQSKSLVVVSLHPYHGAISYADDHVIHVLDESIEQAVEKSQKLGLAVSHLYVNSRMRNQGSDAARKDENPPMLCREGNKPLRATHTDLTNFEVFKHGYYDIYPSQIFHTGNIVNQPDRYEFCLDPAKKYFDTSRNKNLVGFALTDSSQIAEIASFSNAFAFYPRDLADITDYLNKNPKRLIPFIEIGRFLFDRNSGVFRNLDITPLINIVKNSTYHGPVVFLLDEPFWRLRGECFKQKTAACTEINNQYTDSLDVFRKVGKELRKALPNIAMMHIESFVELLYQKKDNPSRNVILLDDAEYLGYDCYGPFENCGVMDISTIFANINSTSQAGLNLVGNFSNPYPDNLLSYKIADREIINFLINQFNTSPLLNDAFKSLSFTESTIDSELNLVCDISNSECVVTNVSNNTYITLRSQSDYIDWIKQTILSLETSNPINRKIFLVPGTFQNFNHFPSEDKVIEQIQAFTQVFDSSSLFGGMGGFLWGDLQEGAIPFIGARSLFSVKHTIAEIFGVRMNQAKINDPTLEFAPGMSLWGAIGTRGSFKEVSVNGAKDGDIYFQNADMDACSLRIGNQSQQPLTLNQLNHIAIPISVIPLEVEAICSKKRQIFSKKVRFIN